MYKVRVSPDKQDRAYIGIQVKLPELQRSHTLASFPIGCEASLQKREYTIIGYKGKQVRDNLHSSDLINCFWQFFKKPKKGAVYNIGGGRYSNCSILEAINEIEQISNIKVKKKIIKQNRIGDHVWYITNNKRFKKDYPMWKQKYNTKKIIKELIKRL